ncbi:ribonuclease domain-containing protein [Butyrivibrio sp. MC2013]|uniref:ribonuclease domain-containing protein n=1 Tax=Butyrivibrio sp. MC2013 TaxID=1280686 RepID=UPI0004226FCC|nr:ribonuclease domain-containing protein [Butyrivibrio sp. MC2013]
MKLKRKNLFTITLLVLFVLAGYFFGFTRNSGGGTEGGDLQLIEEQIQMSEQEDAEPKENRKKEEPEVGKTEDADEAQVELTASDEESGDTDNEYPEASSMLDEAGLYDSKEDVAEYIETYHHLPDNYMTKQEARTIGWEGGALHLVVDGMCIGGDKFSNFEGLLPKKKGRVYYECDIDTLDSESRGPKRIIYTEDGWNIYYTADHYESFEHLSGDD